MDTFRRQLAETREHLGEWLALYQIHSATPDSGVLDNDAVLAAMAEADLPLGVSVSGTRQAETIDRALTLGLFGAVQATWNLHERAAEDALAPRPRAEGDRQGGDGQRPARAARRRGAGGRVGRAVGDVVLSGAASMEVLRSNLRASQTPPPGELPELIEDTEAYWTARGHLQWN